MKRPLHILFAEDNEDDFLLVQAELKSAGFELSARRVETADEMRRALGEEQWDLVLSDFSMPQFDGMSALRVLQDSGRSDTPFIIVSGSIGELRAVEALKAGASNYVMKENLEKLVPVVERELADAQMRRERREAFEALQQAVRARDEFLSIASHELKTPLTALRLQVQSLVLAFEATPEGAALTAERMQSKVESIARSCSRLVVLIERLLDITRVTQGQLELIREPVDLAAIVDDCRAQLEPALGASGSTLTVRGAGPLVGRWDRVRLETAVNNLLDNAIKYGAGKPIDVELEDLGPEVRLRVVDRGIGIEPADQRRIFNRFERAVPERNYGGFGVGLWLSRRIVEAHGGVVTVHSAANQGSTFTVTLPKG